MAKSPDDFKEEDQNLVQGFIDQIDKALKFQYHKTFQASDVRVPIQLQGLIRECYLAAGWKEVKFVNSQKDGAFVTLTGP